MSAIDLILYAVYATSGYVAAYNIDKICRLELRNRADGEYDKKVQQFLEQHSRKVIMPLGESIMLGRQYTKEPAYISEGLKKLKLQRDERDVHLQRDIRILGRWIPDPLLLSWRLIRPRS